MNLNLYKSLMMEKDQGRTNTTFISPPILLINSYYLSSGAILKITEIQERLYFHLLFSML